MQIQRCKVFLNKIQYQNLKCFLEKKHFLIDDIILEDIFPNGNFVKISFQKMNQTIYMNIMLIDKNTKEVLDFKREMLYKKTLENLYRVFGFKNKDTHYLLKIENDFKQTKREIKDRIIKQKYRNDDSLEELILYNNFNNPLELLQLIYICFAQHSINIRYNHNRQYIKLLKEKLEYYGYTNKEAKETYEIIEEETTKEEILNNLIGLLLAELYYPDNKKERLDTIDIRKYVSFKINKYIKLIK